MTSKGSGTTRRRGLIQGSVTLWGWGLRCLFLKLPSVRHKSNPQTATYRNRHNDAIRTSKMTLEVKVLNALASQSEYNGRFHVRREPNPESCLLTSTHGSAT